MIEKSYAKINLFLYVLNKRQDGYHNIYSLMHKIDFYDVIEIKKTDDFGIKINTNIEDINNNSNLSYRAAERFFAMAQIKPQVSIDIKKNIPLGAGLGGGSSNAAYTIKILNKLFDNPLNSGQLIDIAADIGSDVAFFMHNKAAIATGRGEKLEEIECTKGNNKVFLAFPGIHISTAYVYSKFLLTKGLAINKMPFTVAKEGCSIDTIKNHLHNSLESVVMEEFKVVGRLKTLLNQQFGNALLCGSGSSVFSITNLEGVSTELLENTLKSDGVLCRITNLVD